MSGGIPSRGEIANGSYFGNYTNAVGVPVAYDYFATSTNANTKTAWNQLVASASHDITQFFLEMQVFEASASNVQIAMDFAVGPSGSEQPIISNMVISVPANSGQLITVQLPIAVQAGNRISFRYAASQANSVDGFPLGISLKGFDGAFGTEGFAGMEAINGTFGASTPYSTSFTPGLKTFGAYTQLIGATTRNYAGLLIGLDNQGNYDSTNGPKLLVDISIGPSGSEQVIIPSIFWNQFYCNFFGPFFIPIPLGTRVAVLGVTDTAANTGSQGCVVYGLYG